MSMRNDVKAANPIAAQSPFVLAAIALTVALAVVGVLIAVL
jgi:hypothetical protein